MKTAKELKREFMIRKKLRELSEVPIIGNIVKAVNPYHMFDEDINKEG